jgi:hypothetical protein
MSLNKIRERNTKAIARSKSAAFTHPSGAAAVAVALILLPTPGAVHARDTNAFPAEISPSPQATVTSKFYCNIAALTPAERAHHKQLSEKLMAARKDIVESPKGYEFQFSPSDVTLAELAEWVANEAKCCPFFDFHLDLENKGTLLCLRLTGEEGIKPFIRSEFHVPAS